MPGPTFCHLHTHTQYSLLDGASRIADIVQRAREMNQPALAITDHGNMFGVVEFYKECVDASSRAAKDGLPPIKPIIGMEAYIVPNGESRTKREKVEGEYDHHLILWAADLTGYKNLMKLSSYAYLEGFYSRPRVDRELLATYGKGLLAASGCIGSEVPQTILKKDYAAACRRAAAYQEIFGKDGFYFELQEHCGASADAAEAQELAAQQKKVNEAIIRMARELGGKLICTNDSHYTTRSDAKAHDTLLCIGTGKLVSETNRLKFACDEFYLKSGEEMARAFAGIPEALQNTLEVAERCNVKLQSGVYHFPAFQVPGGEDANVFFRRMVQEGLKRRYGDPVPPHVQARADEELRVLEKMKFVGYLLIVWDIIREARSRGIPVGPGRGSAAGSIVCYALGITNLDPLRYNLIFERFVNEGRNEMPDIDIDFCKNRRSDVIEYVQNKYGRDCTANIVTFPGMKAKAAVRDVGRVLDWEIAEVNRLAKLIPDRPGKDVVLRAAPATRKEGDESTYVVDDVPEMAARYQSDERARELVDLARKCEGLARSTGCHPAGLVIADKPVIEYCPLMRDKNGMTLTQFEMAHIDWVGLLKVDFLGLETLTKLKLACQLIKERRGVDIDLDTIPLDDAKTYRMLGRGDARAVFQFESEGMRKLLVDARPDCLEDLVALNAMFRPGPMQNIPAFCARKHGVEKIEYLVPQLEPILKDTYGIIVYQEQVMQIANQVAGFTLSEADRLRKAMGKKDPKLMAKYKPQFLAGCVKNGISREKAEQLYEVVAEFAKYGFNKSHAAAYAFVAYQTAWLKANYPAEFMAGNMSLEEKTEKIVEYIEESRRIGLDVLPPDINTSGTRFGIEGEKLLRFPLGAVKGVGEKAVEAIVAEREKNGAYKDLHDFCERVDGRNANKGCLESLIKAGAFDAIASERGRAALMAAAEDAMAQGATVRQDRSAGQGSLFGGDDAAAGAAARRLPEVPEWPEKQRLEEEKKVLGFYFSGHPLAEARELVEGLSSCSIRGLAEIPEGYTVLEGVYVTHIQNTVTRTKGEKMAVLTVEDFSGTAQVVVFPRVYEKCKDLLQPDRILFVRGTVKMQEGGGGGQKEEGEGSGSPKVSIMAEQLLSVEQAAQEFVSDVGLVINARNGSGGGAQAQVESALGLLRNFPGKKPLYIHLAIADAQGRPVTVCVRAGQKLCVRPAPEMIVALRQIVGKGAVRVTGERTQAQKAAPAWRQRS
ncbi:MAG: DNA polymerase III subunit alpha [Planctomycetota bacterium]|nr:DNA polymerase III subunit alpha [Planctomycetota bacterium]